MAIGRAIRATRALVFIEDNHGRNGLGGDRDDPPFKGVVCCWRTSAPGCGGSKTAAVVVELIKEIGIDDPASRFADLSGQLFGDARRGSQGAAARIISGGMLTKIIR